MKKKKTTKKKTSKISKVENKKKKATLDQKRVEKIKTGFIGRPPAYKSKAELQKVVLSYFSDCAKLFSMPSKAGLCIALKISRETYNQYKKKKKFSDTLKKADMIIEDWWIQRLRGSSPTGAIFYLKNAFKETYKDRHETDITSKGEKVAITGMQIVEEKPTKQAKKK